MNRDDHRGDGARASCDVGTMTPPRERASSSSRAREATSSDGDDATGAFAIGDDDRDRLDATFLDEVVDDFLVESLVVDGFEDDGGDVDGLLTPSMFRACGYFDDDGLGELGELRAGDGAAARRRRRAARRRPENIHAVVDRRLHRRREGENEARGRTGRATEGTGRASRARRRGCCV